MKTIYKYEFPDGKEIKVEMPEDAVVLKYGVCGFRSNGNPLLACWAFVDTDKQKKPYRFRVYCTGDPMPSDAGIHCANTGFDVFGGFLGYIASPDFVWADTVIDRRESTQYVWHIFKEK